MQIAIPLIKSKELSFILQHNLNWLNYTYLVRGFVQEFFVSFDPASLSVVVALRQLIKGILQPKTQSQTLWQGFLIATNAVQEEFQGYQSGECNSVRAVPEINLRWLTVQRWQPMFPPRELKTAAVPLHHKQFLEEPCCCTWWYSPASGQSVAEQRETWLRGHRHCTKMQLSLLPPCPLLQRHMPVRNWGLRWSSVHSRHYLSKQSKNLTVTPVLCLTCATSAAIAHLGAAVHSSGSGPLPLECSSPSDLPWFQKDIAWEHPLVRHNSWQKLPFPARMASLSVVAYLTICTLVEHSICLSFHICSSQSKSKKTTTAAGISSRCFFIQPAFRIPLGMYHS